MLRGVQKLDGRIDMGHRWLSTLRHEMSILWFRVLLPATVLACSGGLTCFRGAGHGEGRHFYFWGLSECLPHTSW